MINSQHFVSKKLHWHPTKITIPKKQTKKCSKVVIFRRFFYTYLFFIVIKMLLDPRVTRTPNLLIWSQTRYHCAIGPHTMTTDFVVYDQKCLFGGSVIISMSEILHRRRPMKDWVLSIHPFLGQFWQPQRM